LEVLMTTPVTENERAKILRLARDGTKYRDVARILGRPYGTIASIISRAILDGELERRREREDRRELRDYSY
jgi:DNA-directed RNA polymerase specialized sigma24 family protein